MYKKIDPKTGEVEKDKNGKEVVLLFEPARIPAGMNNLPPSQDNY